MTLLVEATALTSHGRRFIIVLARAHAWFGTRDHDALLAVEKVRGECLYDLARETVIAEAKLDEWAKAGEPFDDAAREIFAGRHDRTLIETLATWWSYRLLDADLMRRLADATREAA